MTYADRNSSKIDAYSGARTMLAVFAACLALLGVAFLFRLGVLYALLAIGLGFSAYGIYLVFQAKATHSWVPSEGQIRSVRTVKEHDFTQDEPLWRVAVEYAYEYRGRSFVSSRIRFSRRDEKCPSQAEAAAMVGKYPSGSRVSVRANPRRAGTAVLEAGISKRVASHYHGVIASGVVVSAATLLLMWFLL